MQNDAINFTEELVYQWQEKWSKDDLRKMVEYCANDTVLLPYLLKYLDKDSVSLECGCGLGQWVVYMSRRGYKMAGVEIVPECIRVCKEYYPDADIKVGDVRELPYPDNYFGGYISIGVLEHMIEGPDRSISEMHRVLKPGGVAIVIVPALNYFMRLWYPLREAAVRVFRYNALLRRIFGRPGFTGNIEDSRNRLEEIKKQFYPGLWPSIGIDPVKGPMFIEYKCKKGFIEDKIKIRGFEIVEAAPLFHLYVFNDVFGTIFFREGYDISDPTTLNLNLPGRLLKKAFDLISPYFFNYAHLYVVRKI